jgi:hypothetical protein
VVYRVTANPTPATGWRQGREMCRLFTRTANVAAAATGPLPQDLMAALREHRWDGYAPCGSLS